jgi:excisionase family DNA binding protein
MEVLSETENPVNRSAAAELLRALSRAAREAGIEFSEKLAYTFEDAATVTTLSARFLQDLASAGDLPVVRCGQRVLIRAGDLRQWVDAGCPHQRWSAAAAEKRAAAKPAPVKRRAGR